MKLQIALDTFDLEEAMSVLEAVHQDVDIAEAGTGLILANGVEAVRRIKEGFPALEVLADIKMMDGGGSLAGYALDAGADLVSVLGVSDDATIGAAVQAATERGKHVFADMIGVTDVAQRARRLDELGVRYICVHTPYDLRESVAPPVSDLEQVKDATQAASTVITGGIKLHSLPEVLKHRPDVVVAGSGIMQAQDIAATAHAYATEIHGA